MTNLIIALIIAGYLAPGIWVRSIFLRTDRGLKTGFCSAVATILLWPAVWAAECAEWMREG